MRNFVNKDKRFFYRDRIRFVKWFFKLMGGRFLGIASLIFIH